MKTLLIIIVAIITTPFILLGVGSVGVFAGLTGGQVVGYSLVALVAYKFGTKMYRAYKAGTIKNIV